jgi:NAD kinase
MHPFTLDSTSGSAQVDVLVTPSGDCAPQLLTIQAWANELGVEVIELGTSAEPNHRDPGCQLVIALGGDGTILRALQLSMTNHAAVLGVNFGHMGFLADIHRHDLDAALDAIARGEAGVDERTALDAIVLTPLATQGSPLRSLVVEGSDTVRIEMDPASAPLTVEIDGRTIHQLPASAAIEVHAAPRKARLVRTRPRTFYEDLASRL